MSYYATIDGMIELKREVDPNTIIERLNGFAAECGPEMMSSDDDSFTVYFGGYQNYCEDDILAFLADTAPHTVSGEVTYCGEENSFWRHYFDTNTGEWIEQNGFVGYEKEGKSISSLLARNKAFLDEKQTADKGDDAR